MKQTGIKIIRILLLTVGITGLLWFVLPAPLLSVNLGNITGTVVFGLLTAYALLFKRVNRAACRIWKSVIGKAALCTAAAVAVLIAAAAVAASVCMISAVRIECPENSTAVVLGCRVYGERPSLMLVRRLGAAKEYLDENPDADCILSGGMGEGEDISEAECMYRWLRDNGISKGRLLKEDRSVSTHENILFSKELIEDNGLDRNVVIITNDFHQYRAVKEAEQAGFDTIGTRSGRTEWWLFPTYCVREMYGVLYEWFF